MQVLIAKLIKKVADDGITDIQDDVEIGKEYYVSPKNIGFNCWVRKDNEDIKVLRVTVLVANTIIGEGKGLMPVELLSFFYREMTTEEEATYTAWREAELNRLRSHPVDPQREADS